MRSTFLGGSALAAEIPSRMQEQKAKRRASLKGLEVGKIAEL